MDTHKRLRQLLNERGWTEYRLSKECGLSESTLANIFRRNTTNFLLYLLMYEGLFYEEIIFLYGYVDKHVYNIVNNVHNLLKACELSCG